MPKFPLAVVISSALALTACAAAPDQASSEAAEEEVSNARWIEVPNPPGGAEAPLSSQYEEAVGTLVPGESTPLAIQTASDKRDLDLAGSRLAGHEALLLASSNGRTTYARGVPLRSGALKTSLFAWDEGREETSVGVLENGEDASPGLFMVAIRVGSGPDSDDAGSFVGDFTKLTGPVQDLLGKPIKVKAHHYDRVRSVLRGRTLVSEDYAIVSTFYRRRSP